VILKARLPFDFRLSAGISDGFDGRELHLPLRSERSAILAVITEGLEEPELEVEFKSRDILSGSELRSAEAMISRMLNLDMNLMDFYESIDDVVLLRLLAGLKGLKVIHTQSVLRL